MLYSMTGFGSAVVRGEDVSVAVELKTVNNRYFKLALRITDGFAALESDIESGIRKSIARGTVNASIRIRREKRASECKLDLPVLRAYYEQLVELGTELGHLGEFPHPRLDGLIALPGVVEADLEYSDEETGRIRALVDQAIREALNRLQNMRKTEGDSMGRDLAENVQSLKRLVGEVEKLTPNVAPQYRQRLTERIGKIMSEQNLTLNEADLVREIALFADRCDISEETVRFHSHLEQFESAMNDKESCGRKLDFLTQELFREANTMGSKANDAGITRHVVEMKTVIERIREQVQNIE